MNHNSAPPMGDYPSPPPPEHHNGFYAASSVPPQDQRVPDPEDLQLTAQLSGSLANDADAQIGQIDQSQNNQYENQQPQQYDGQQGQQLGHQISHGGMEHGQGQPGYGAPGTPGNGEPKKRSKVSRACDECRRKKIRCDSFSETDTCSNCKRVGARCQFSRVPQKRGPSKGYIKELSDRVNNLEARERMHPPEVPYAPMSADGVSPRGYNEFSPGPSGGLSQARKRNHSAISSESPYSYPRQSLDWQNQRSPYQGGQGADTGYPSYPSDNMAPQPTWRNAPDGARRMSASLETTALNGHIQSDRNREWNNVLERYYTVIHPILPLLPSTPTKFLARISRPNCPVRVEDALYDAIQLVNGCVLVGDGSSARPELGNRNLHDEAIKIPFDAPGSRTMATNILYLQAMLLRVIESDTLGPDSISQRALWLGLAVGLAATMKLHISIPHEHAGEVDPDSDEWLGRRVWWCLVILDRWHALSTASPVMIPDSSIVPFNVDKVILGETTYQLSRLSIVQGHVARILVLPQGSSSETTAYAAQSMSVFSQILNGEMERCRESFQVTDYSMYPIMHLHVLYYRLLIKRIDPAIEPLDLLASAVQIAEILRTTNPVTPFNHHFAAVAAITLVELRDIHGMAEETAPAIQWLTDANAGRNLGNEGKDWYSTMMNLISGGKISELLTGTGRAKEGTSGASLHHLADLATAAGDRTEGKVVAVDGETVTGTGTRKEDDAAGIAAAAIQQEQWDPSALLRSGYLCVFASYSSAKQ